MNAAFRPQLSWVWAVRTYSDSSSMRIVHMCLCAVVCCGSISLKENRKLEVGKDI